MLSSASETLFATLRLALASETWPETEAVLTTPAPEARPKAETLSLTGSVSRVKALVLRPKTLLATLVLRPATRPIVLLLSKAGSVTLRPMSLPGATSTSEASTAPATPTRPVTPVLSIILFWLLFTHNYTFLSCNPKIYS